MSLRLSVMVNVECEGELEGVRTCERGETGYSVLREWKDVEVFEEVSGHWFALSRAVDAERLKVEATPKAATDFKFQREFDCDGLKQAGFGLTPFGSVVETIGGALKGDESMTAELNADDSDGVDVHITVAFAHFVAKYKLALERVPIAAIDKVKTQMLISRKLLAETQTQMEEMKSEFAAERHTAEKKLAAAKQLSDELASQLSKAKAFATAERRAADKTMADLRAEIRIREAHISELAKGRMSAVTTVKTTVGFRFDERTEGGWTDPKKFHILAHGKVAAATRKYAQITLKPKVATDCCQLTLEIVAIKGRVSVGITNDYSKTVGLKGVAFNSDGDVVANGSLVAASQHFGDWHAGDRLFLSAELSSRTLSIRSHKGTFSAEWKPRTSALCFAVYCNDASTKLRIIG